MTGVGPYVPCVCVAPDAVGAVRFLAARLEVEVAARVAERGVCRMALAGGSTPRRLYEHLAAGGGQARLPWQSLEVFFGDERCVGPDDPHSNLRMARESLLDLVPIPPGSVHPIDGLAPPEEAAVAYAAVLGTEPLDVVLLGLGEDGHTASLFPETPGLREDRRAVVATRSPAPPRDRISLSLGTLNAARAVYFMVTGAAKAAAFARVVGEAGLADAGMPAALVRPALGRVTWVLDAPAARLSPWRLR